MLKFRNPLSPGDAPDPCIVYDNVTKYYYCVFTLIDHIKIYRSRKLSALFSDNDTKFVFGLNEELKILCNMWAPELHKAPNGKWYIYSCASELPTGDSQMRIFVLECQSADPFGEWKYMGKPLLDMNAIDPTVLTLPNGDQYACFSYSEKNYWDHNLIGICKMTSPFTFDQNITTLSRATLDWELVPPHHDKRTLNEGPYFIQTEKDIFLVYSANGCWSNHYCLGMLRYKGGEICNKDSWEKLPKPLLSCGNGVFGPGHATFMNSPDGKELWCVYHGMKSSNDTCTHTTRYLNVQKVEFDKDGIPVMGLPVGYETELDPPSGE